MLMEPSPGLSNKHPWPNLLWLGNRHVHIIPAPQKDRLGYEDMQRFLILVFLASGFPSGCIQPVEILAIGDSVLAWGAEDQTSIPHIAAEHLDLSVQNNATSGAYLSVEEAGGFGNGGGDIRSQYTAGDWTWLIMDGGANDINDECGCNECTENIEGMINADGTSGDLVVFIEQILSSGPMVALMSYYTVSEEAEYGFHRCNDEVGLLQERYRALANRHDTLVLVDAALAISPDTTVSAYDDDQVHPSLDGRERIGTLFADQMNSN